MPPLLPLLCLHQHLRVPSALTTVQSLSLSSSLIIWINLCLGTSSDRNTSFLPVNSVSAGSATTVVFDCYDEGQSVKDNTHERRGQNMHPIVSFTVETEFSGKEEFLSRDVNKQRLITSTHHYADLRRYRSISLSCSFTMHGETLWLFTSNQTEPNLMAVLICMTSTV